ncbi:hypothetical protein OGATHE_005633 [Ogataea polymorpha]|uniref:Uncharacterized protein n=1 Tax=Ogataea polymorpha TaxID=460523 RepID=A0A9P8NSC9_9ASCO|nr:hypothetical protein OGATHE_005633 [Ogataea polymorpha]
MPKVSTLILLSPKHVVCKTAHWKKTYGLDMYSSIATSMTYDWSLGNVGNEHKSEDLLKKFPKKAFILSPLEPLTLKTASKAMSIER